MKSISYRRPHFLTLGAFVLFCGSLLHAQPAPLKPNGVEVLTNYFDMLQSDNIESAGYMWTDSDQERATRFGITYTDIPLKVDATSPIIRNLDIMKNHLQRPVKSMETFEKGAWSRMSYGTVVMGKMIEHDYWAVRNGSNFWLCYPQDYYARNWDVVQSKYLRIHVHPDVKKYLNDVALADADSHIEQLARTLSLGNDALKQLADKKIEYFYCDSDSTVMAITGHLTKGTTDLASNDIISAFFPHYHEIVHLLVNIKLHRLPLYTLPLMREGIAVHLGGRWGKAPSALDDLGSFLFRQDFISLDSILTMEDFNRNAQADIAYPVAGLFAGYLLKKEGWDDYQKLYLDLSGPFDSLYIMGKETVKNHLLAATNQSDWDQLIADFGKYLDEQTKNNQVIKPGALEKGDELVANDHVLVREDGDWISFEFMGGDGKPAGNFLFGHDKRLDSVRSMSFDEQYEDSVVFAGYRFGVRYDTNEAGLYDYVSNQLVAKYIWGITPSDLYYDQSNRRIAISLKKDLMGYLLPSNKDHDLLPN